MFLTVKQIRDQTKSSLYGKSLFLMANTIVTVGLGFVFWGVVASTKVAGYTEAEVDLGAAIISAISLLALFSVLGVDVALICFLPKAEKPVEMINSCTFMRTHSSRYSPAVFDVCLCAVVSFPV